MPGARKRRVQVGARHGIARLCPAVHNMLPEKTYQRTTQFFRSVLGDESAMSAHRTPKDDDAWQPIFLAALPVGGGLTRRFPNGIRVHTLSQLVRILLRNVLHHA
jgi:hypothetical protein